MTVTPDYNDHSVSLLLCVMFNIRNSVVTKICIGKFYLVTTKYGKMNRTKCSKPGKSVPSLFLLDIVMHRKCFGTKKRFNRINSYCHELF